eukprot:6789015-Ditylum_brightwellii.AAC.1
MSISDSRAYDGGKISKGVYFCVQSVNWFIGVEVEIFNSVTKLLQLGQRDLAIGVKHIIKYLRDSASDLACDRIVDG